MATNTINIMGMELQAARLSSLPRHITTFHTSPSFKFRAGYLLVALSSSSAARWHIANANDIEARRIARIVTAREVEGGVIFSVAREEEHPLEKLSEWGHVATGTLAYATKLGFEWSGEGDILVFVHCEKLNGLWDEPKSVQELVEGYERLPERSIAF